MGRARRRRRPARRDVDHDRAGDEAVCGGGVGKAERRRDRGEHARRADGHRPRAVRRGDDADYRRGGESREGARAARALLGRESGVAEGRRRSHPGRSPARAIGDRQALGRAERDTRDGDDLAGDRERPGRSRRVAGGPRARGRCRPSGGDREGDGPAREPARWGRVGEGESGGHGLDGTRRRDAHRPHPVGRDDVHLGRGGDGSKRASAGRLLLHTEGVLRARGWCDGRVRATARAVGERHGGPAGKGDAGDGDHLARDADAARRGRRVAGVTGRGRRGAPTGWGGDRHGPGIKAACCGRVGEGERRPDGLGRHRRRDRHRPRAIG